MKSIAHTAALSALLLLSACSASATLVRKDELGGRVSLRGGFMPSVAKAKVLMADHCAGPFRAQELPQALEFSCGEQPGGYALRGGSSGF